MKHAPFPKQPHTNARSSSLADFRAEGFEQRLYIPPRNGPAGGITEDSIKRSLMSPVQAKQWYQETVPRPSGRTGRPRESGAMSSCGGDGAAVGVGEAGGAGQVGAHGGGGDVL